MERATSRIGGGEGLRACCTCTCTPGAEPGLGATLNVPGTMGLGHGDVGHEGPEAEVTRVHFDDPTIREPLCGSCGSKEEPTPQVGGHTLICFCEADPLDGERLRFWTWGGAGLGRVGCEAVWMCLAIALKNCRPGALVCLLSDCPGADGSTKESVCARCGETGESSRGKEWPGQLRSGCEPWGFLTETRDNGATCKRLPGQLNNWPAGVADVTAVT